MSRSGTESQRRSTKGGAKSDPPGSRDDARGESLPPPSDAESTSTAPAEGDPSAPGSEPVATSDTGARPSAADGFVAALAGGASSAARWVWGHARRLALRGTQATRPLEIGLRAVGIALAGLAPVWPLIGSPPTGWWDWLLTTLANVGVGLVLFGAGETVRKVNEMHRTIHASPWGLATGDDEREAGR